MDNVWPLDKFGPSSGWHCLSLPHNFKVVFVDKTDQIDAVSYTHLTLPTKRIV